MRTKTLLAAAAIIAAGVASSQAQSNVYSLNIVGYVNKVINPGYNLIANPLSSGTNGVDNVIVVPDASIVVTFDGVAYDSRYIDTGAWLKSSDDSPTTAPTVPPGRGFFFFNPNPAFTNTFVGSVVPSPGATNTLSLPPGYSLVGSVLPVAGAATAAPVGVPAIDACIIVTFDGIAYDSRYLDTGAWLKSSDDSPTSDHNLTVGQGFFYFNPGLAAPWTHTLP